MSTLLLLKTLAISTDDEYLKNCLITLEIYINKHTGANIIMLIDDNYVNVYDGRVFLLKLSTMRLNEMGGR